MLNNKLNKFLQKIIELRSIKYLKDNNIYEYINNLRMTYPTTGCGASDYAFLHRYVRRYKPRKFLECGTGLSTHVIAHAMNMFSSKHGEDIVLVSMESEKSWYDYAMKYYPEAYNRFLKIVYSPIENYQYSFVTGTSYQSIPEHEYDAVYIDGPDQRNMCNMDFVKILLSSNKKMTGIIDLRRETGIAYSALFGTKKIFYYPSKIGMIGPVDKSDLVCNSYASTKNVFNQNVKIKYNIKNLLFT